MTGQYIELRCLRSTVDTTSSGSGLAVEFLPTQRLDCKPHSQINKLAFARSSRLIAVAHQ